MSSSHLKAVGITSVVLLVACGDKVSLAPRERATLVSSAVRVPSANTDGAPVETFFAVQKLIRSAELRIEVKDVPTAVRTADSVAKQNAAFVADSRITRDARDGQQARLVVRVLSDRLAATMAALRRLGDVREEAVNTQDITKEYADLDTRLAVKEQTVARLRLLIDNRTAKLSDVLEVERELARAVTELEQMKGERRYYDQQVALSTIIVSLFDQPASRSVQLTGPVAGAFRGSLDVLGTSLSGMIYLITFLIPWIAIAIPIWWLVTRLRGRARSALRDRTASADSGT